MKILVTGFGSFPGVPHNISSEIAGECAAHWSQQPGLKVEVLKLETTWETASGIVKQTIKGFQPDALIHLGVSGKTTGLTLETVAYNACDARPDSCNQTPVRATVRGKTSSASLATTAPIAAISEALRDSGVPFAISVDPGRYLCNAVYYEALAGTADCAPYSRCIFVHLPARLSCETVTRGQVMRGLDVVLDAMRSN